jgi:hypothetical protein
MEPIQKAPNNGLELIASAKQQIDALAMACKNIVINNDESLERGKVLAKEARKIEQFIEEKRKEATKPLLDKKKQIDDFAKHLTNELNNAVKPLRAQIQKYEEEKERQRLEELRRIEEDRRRQEEALRVAQQQGDVEQITKIQEISELEAKAAELSEKSSSLRMIWTFEVENINLVPKEYMLLDETAVRRAIQAGVREIPGLRIFQKPSLVIK